MTPGTDDDQRESVSVSAPGKVLITGGYLVLDEQYSGIVLATTARFYSHVTIEPSNTLFPADNGYIFGIVVESPQYEQTITGWIGKEDEKFVFNVRDGSDRNAYIEETILCVINGIAGVVPIVTTAKFQELHAAQRCLRITLQADNDFYSQLKRLQDAGKPPIQTSLAELPPFLPPTMEEKSDGTLVAIKTGMGSSAALVTSLTGALVRILVPSNRFFEVQEDLELVHNLAQLAHCYIQRKIGSGFDVSAACFGSHRYSRFPATILDTFTSPERLIPIAIAQYISDRRSWAISDRVKPFQLPPEFHLLMGDVSAGSATVSMVRQVLNWQKTQPKQAADVISALNANNMDVEAACFQLQELFRINDAEVIRNLHDQRKLLATSHAHEWKSVSPVLGDILSRLRESFIKVRRMLREMGDLAQVPIEPSSQTELIDATMAIPGVLIAGVPGAGGFDAVFVLVLDRLVLDKVQELWLKWPEKHPNTIICPLLLDTDTSKISSETLVQGLQCHSSVSRQ